MKKYGIIAVLLVCFAAGVFAQERRIRIGLFPNVTHAQGLIAQAEGAYEKALGVEVEWVMFNAGPTAVEALFTGAIDATYIGPNPAINGYIKSKGQSFFIVAGSAMGGAALVTRREAGVKDDKGFAGKVIATPQLGNTQDVAARAWLKDKGLKLKERGGNVTIIPLRNADQLAMFQKGEIDAAWTVEPWVSRLEKEANGIVYLDEKKLWKDGKYVTTLLVVSRKFAEQNGDLVKKLVQEHVSITEKLQADKQAFVPVINAGIKKHSGSELPVEIVQSALTRVDFSSEPLEEAMVKSAHMAYEAGFFRTEPDIKGIYNLVYLKDVLKETVESKSESHE